jgi:glycosyltransferase involved in cell wall biosynthesis
MEKYNPLVSVCMPAYNAEKYIHEAIQSVIDQTYANWELIIVNDGSTDNTIGVAELFTDKRIKIFYQQNKGQCAAANKAFELSNGDLIKFFDADDIMSRNMLRSQVTRIAGNSQDVVSARWGRFYNDDIGTFKLNPEPVWQDMPAINWLISALTTGYPMMQCALWLIPRPTLYRSGLWDEDLSLINDFDFFSRVLSASRNVLFEPAATLYYRSGIPGSLSSQTKPEHAQSAFKSISKGAAAILAIDQSSAAKRAIANIFQTLAHALYPFHKKIVLDIEKQIKTLGGSTISWHYSKISYWLSKLFGWKTASNIRVTIRKLFNR